MRKILPVNGTDKDVMAQIKDEIIRAIEADRNKRKFPPFKCLARIIEDNTLDTLTEDIRTMLADYLLGKHRGKRGLKISDSQQPEIDMARAELLAELLGKCRSINDAYVELAIKEKMGGRAREDHGSDISGIQKSVKRGIQYMKDDIAELEEKLIALRAKKTLLALSETKQPLSGGIGMK